jgi:hypothetical protein
MEKLVFNPVCGANRSKHIFGFVAVDLGCLVFPDLLLCFLFLLVFFIR